MTAKRPRNYYVLAFNDGSVVRVTFDRHETVVSALAEQYGRPAPCHFAKAKTKTEALDIACGKRPGLWLELFFDHTTKPYKLRSRHAAAFALKVEGVVQ